MTKISSEPGPAQIRKIFPQNFPNEPKIATAVPARAEKAAKTERIREFARELMISLIKQRKTQIQKSSQS